MRKKFLSITLLGALTLAATSTFVSCKDYDDDIADLQAQINSVNSDFSSQLTTLNNALAQAKSEAAAASAAAETAKNDAEAFAKQEAAAAAATAKAEAIEEAIKQVNAAKEAVETSNASAIANLRTELESEIAANKNDIATVKQSIDEAVSNSKAYTDSKASALSSEINGLKTELGAKLDGIQNGLSTLNGDENVTGSVAYKVAQAKQDLQIQIDALDKYQKNLESAMNTADGELKASIETVNTKVADTKTELEGKINTLSSKFSEYSTTDEVKALIKEASDAIDKKLDAISESINSINGEIKTLHTLITVRLTSMTFIPTYYLGGIETILFENINYTPQKNNQNGVLADNGEATEKYLDANVSYRMNPSGVNINTLDTTNMAFVASKALTRAANGNIIEPINGSATYNQATSTLNFKAKQVGQLQNGENGAIDIVCLKMPLKGEALAKDETEAFVYSDYAQVRSTKSDVKFYVGADNSYGKTTVSEPIYMGPDSITAYSDPRNANTTDHIYSIGINAGDVNLADSVKIFSVDDQDGTIKMYGAEELQRAGFTVEFAKATAAYKPEGESENNQQYITVDKSGKVEVSSATAAKNRTPIVVCRVMDGDKIVTESYFRVKIGGDFKTTLTATDDGNMCKASHVVLTAEAGKMSVNIPADTLNKYIYEPLGINKNEFESKYTPSIVTEDGKTCNLDPSWFTLDENGYTLTIPVGTQTDEAIWKNTNMGGLVNGADGTSNTAKVVWTNNTGNEITFIMDIVLKPITVAVGHQRTYWTSDEFKEITANPSTTSKKDYQTAAYVMDVHDCYTMVDDNTPKYIIKSGDETIDNNNSLITKGGYKFHWDYNTTDVKGVQVEGSSLYLEERENNTTTAILSFGELGKDGNFGSAAAQKYLNNSNDKREDVKVLLSLVLPVELASGKTIEVENPSIKYIRPLEAIGGASLTWIDAIHTRQTLSVNNVCVIKDWQNQKVTSGSNLWNYYSIYTPLTFKTVDRIDEAGNSYRVVKVVTDRTSTNGLDYFASGAESADKIPASSINTDMNTNLPSGTSVVLTEENGVQCVEYQNNGALVNEPYWIGVQVEVNHKWGTLTSDYLWIHVVKTTGNQDLVKKQ